MVPPHYIRFRNRNRGQIDLKALRVAVPIVGPLRCTEDVPWRGLTTEEWLRRVGRSSIFGYR